MNSIHQISNLELSIFSSIPISFRVDSIYQIDSDTLRLTEIPVDQPYIKNYDDYGEPLSWIAEFDISNWALFIAAENDCPVGGAAVAWNTNGVNMLEERIDLSVLWDIRVHPDHRGRGVGKTLFLAAADWSRSRGCVEMKIETQNNNVNACKFYQRMGCVLKEIRHGAYSEPELADEIMMLWYLDLRR